MITAPQPEEDPGAVSTMIGLPQSTEQLPTPQAAGSIQLAEDAVVSSSYGRVILKCTTPGERLQVYDQHRSSAGGVSRPVEMHMVSQCVCVFLSAVVHSLQVAVSAAWMAAGLASSAVVI